MFYKDATDQETLELDNATRQRRTGFFFLNRWRSSRRTNPFFAVAKFSIEVIRRLESASSIWF